MLVRASSICPVVLMAVYLAALNWCHAVASLARAICNSWAALYFMAEPIELPKQISPHAIHPPAMIKQKPIERAAWVFISVEGVITVLPVQPHRICMRTPL